MRNRVLQGLHRFHTLRVRRSRIDMESAPHFGRSVNDIRTSFRGEKEVILGLFSTNFGCHRVTTQVTSPF